MKERLSILNRIDNVIATSNTLAHLLKLNGVNRNIEICPQPINEWFLAKPEKINKKDNKTILYIGGGEPFKGFHVLMEAFNIIEQEIKPCPTLIITGQKRKDHKIDDTKYSPNVKLLWEIDKNKLKELYYLADILVFPSLWYEAFGRGWAEALCCGLPVLSFKNRGGAADYLKHNETGYLVDENMTSFVNGIKELLENDSLREKIAKNGKEFAIKKLVNSKVINIVEEIIYSTIHKS